MSLFEDYLIDKYYHGLVSEAPYYYPWRTPLYNYLFDQIMDQVYIRKHSPYNNNEGLRSVLRKKLYLDFLLKYIPEKGKMVLDVIKIFDDKGVALVFSDEELKDNILKDNSKEDIKLKTSFIAEKFFTPRAFKELLELYINKKSITYGDISESKQYQRELYKSAFNILLSRLKEKSEY